jgi:catechol 2,3-dioxygenase-like lactoylglutathione lyase family enzyme
MMEASPFDTHGRIKCGTVSSADFDRSLADYNASLGLAVVAAGVIPPELALAWGVPWCAGRRQVLLHGGGRPCYLRLIEATRVPGYAPLRTHGWAAFEISVADVHALHARLSGSAFRVLGAPGKVGDFASFIPFQVAGRAGEVLFLNQVLSAGVDGIDLPFATVEVDQIFIVPLATSDRAVALAFHVDALGFAAGATYTLPYTVINAAFGLPADHRTTLTMTRVGSIAASEIDQYPPEATARPVPSGELPPGNAMVSFVVDSLDAVRVPLLGPPTRGDGLMYDGRRVGCVRGTAGEIIELIEAAR